MGRETGMNFTVGKRWRYRIKATHLLKLDVVKAVSAGFLFHENKYTGIVYGLGLMVDGRGNEWRDTAKMQW